MFSMSLQRHGPTFPQRFKDVNSLQDRFLIKAIDFLNQFETYLD